MDPVVRPARATDTARLGDVHVLAWQAAYRGVMPDAYLDGLDPADRAELWQRFIDVAPPGRHLDVVLDADGAVAGFAHFGPSADGEEGAGELYAINLDPAAWGRGLGGALVAHVEAALHAGGYREAVLWVVPSNVRARAVYERHGWSADGAARSASVLGATVDEVRYRLVLEPTE